MEKRSRIEAVDGEIMLPEPLIQHIQSFLTRREAAQTTVLSKPWYSAWLTRPNLEFDPSDFQIDGALDRRAFHKFAKETMERYENLNLKIESLKLATNDVRLGKNILVKAMRMEASDLSFQTSSSTFVLPNEVLESKKLKRLSLSGCKIVAKPTWSGLEYLSLCGVGIEGDLICDIISTCSSTEKLVLSGCKYMFKPQSPQLVRWSPRVLALDHSLINVYEFQKLKCLYLDMVKISSEFFTNFSVRFPVLVILVVHNCFGFRDIHIKSYSLESISFEHKKILRATFNVPRMRLFTFSGSYVPLLSFYRTSREWKSDIYIRAIRFRSSWFLKLNQFLSKLSRSKISLSLMIGIMLDESFNFTEHGRFPAVVEKLMIVAVAPEVNSAVMAGLFCCIHPKCIHQIRMPMSSPLGEGRNELLELLEKTLVQKWAGNWLIVPNRNSYALRDLEEVSAHIYEDAPGEFPPRPWRAFLDDPDKGQRIIFKLKWGRGF